MPNFDNGIKTITIQQSCPLTLVIGQLYWHVEGFEHLSKHPYETTISVTFSVYN